MSPFFLLMIERDGDLFRASYFDGNLWQVLYEEQHDFAGTPLSPYLLTSNSDSNPAWEVTLDDFAAVIVPEPSALLLAAAGLVLFLACAAYNAVSRS